MNKNTWSINQSLLFCRNYWKVIKFLCSLPFICFFFEDLFIFYFFDLSHPCICNLNIQTSSYNLPSHNLPCHHLPSHNLPCHVIFLWFGFDRDDVKLKRGYLDCRYMGESETKHEMVDCWDDQEKCHSSSHILYILSL